MFKITTAGSILRFAIKIKKYTENKMCKCCDVPQQKYSKNILVHRKAVFCCKHDNKFQLFRNKLPQYQFAIMQVSRNKNQKKRRVFQTKSIQRAIKI